MHVGNFLFLFFCFRASLEYIGHSLAYIFRLFCIFERCLDWNPQSNQARYQLLPRLSPYLATQCPTWPPFSLLGHPSPYLASHLPTWPPISLLGHPSHYLATHHSTWPPVSLIFFTFFNVTIFPFSYMYSTNNLYGSKLG